jgi:hypothetical protein
MTHRAASLQRRYQVPINESITHDVLKVTPGTCSTSSADQTQVSSNAYLARRALLMTPSAKCPIDIRTKRLFVV